MLLVVVADEMEEDVEGELVWRKLELTVDDIIEAILLAHFDFDIKAEGKSSDGLCTSSP